MQPHATNADTKSLTHIADEPVRMVGFATNDAYRVPQTQTFLHKQTAQIKMNAHLGSDWTSCLWLKNTHTQILTHRLQTDINKKNIHTQRWEHKQNHTKMHAHTHTYPDTCTQTTNIHTQHKNADASMHTHTHTNDTHRNMHTVLLVNFQLLHIQYLLCMVISI